MSGKRIASNAGYLATLTASNYFLGLLIFPYLSRVLSVEVFGLYGFAMAFVIIFQVIVEYGFMISATAKISLNHSDTIKIGEIISDIILAKLMLTVVSILVFISAALMLPTVREHFVFILLFLISGIVAALVPDFYYRGVERMRSIALRALITKAFALLLIFVLVKSDEDILWAPVSLIFGNLIALALSLLGARRAGIVFKRFNLRNSIAELREGLWFFASRASASIGQIAGTFVLGIHYSPASLQLGLFSGASRIAAAGEQAITPIADAVYPYMVRTRNYRTFWIIYLIGLIPWSAGCLSVFIWADPIITFILGEDYSAAAGLLRILVVSTFVAYSNVFFGYPALTPLGKASQANAAIVASAIIVIVAYFWLHMVQAVTVENVCFVMILSNLSAFLYRFVVFVSSRKISTQAQ